MIVQLFIKGGNRYAGLERILGRISGDTRRVLLFHLDMFI